MTTSTPSAEARQSLLTMYDTLGVIDSLVKTDNLKYLTRADRDVHVQTLLENLSSLEDALRALIKSVRTVKRARIRDDDLISRMASALTSSGVSVADLLEGAATEAAEDDSPPETLTVSVEVPEGGPESMGS